jgi:hypothetical protein
MKTKLTLVLLVAVIIALAMVGCIGGPKGTQIKLSDEDFKSDTGGKLLINNYSGSDLAIFVGNISKGNFIGAIGTGVNGRAMSRTFDIEKKLTGLPAVGTFIIRATTFSEFERKGLANINEEDVIYTGLVVYNKDIPERVEHDIYRGIDFTKKTFIHVQNNSEYVLELRLGSSDGEKVAVLGPRAGPRKIWVKPNDSGLALSLFATYLYLDPTTKEMNAFTDTANLYGKSFEPEPAGPDLRIIPFDGPGAGGPKFNVAFLSIQNGTAELFYFGTGEGNYRQNDRGSRSTSPGRSDIYQVDATGGKNYPTAGFYFPDQRKYYPLEKPLDLQPGHKYDIVVSSPSGVPVAKIEDKGLKSVTESIKVVLFGE